MWCVKGRVHEKLLFRTPLPPTSGSTPDIQTSDPTKANCSLNPHLRIRSCHWPSLPFGSEQYLLFEPSVLLGYKIYCCIELKGILLRSQNQSLITEPQSSVEDQRSGYAFQFTLIIDIVYSPAMHLPYVP